MTETIKNASVWIGGVKVAECETASCEIQPPELPPMSFNGVPFPGIASLGNGRMPKGGPLLGWTRSGEVEIWAPTVHLTAMTGDKLAVGKVLTMNASNGSKCPYRVTRIIRQTDTETEFEAERIDG
jgi:hypothetical protein